MNTKHLILIIGILSVSLLLRIVNLDISPPAITNDEVNAAYNSYSLATTGKDVSGQSWFKAAFLTPQNYTMTEFLAVAAVPWIKVFGLSMASVRSWYAVLGALTTGLLFLITKKLTHNQAIAILSAGILAVMPWHIHFSRLGYDGMLALFWLLLGTTIILYAKSKTIFLAIPFYILSFHSYHAFKLIVAPFIIALVIYLSKTNAKKTIAIALFVVIWMAIYLPLFQKYSAAQSRTDELLINSEEVTKKVNRDRQNSLVYQPITTVFSNKFTYSIRKITDNAFSFFSPNMLFLTGEGNTIFSTHEHGLFYSFEIIFLIIGIHAIWRRNKRLALFLICTILIAILPSVLNVYNQAYALRSLAVTPWAAIVIAYGIYALVTSFKTNYIKKASIITITISYTLGLGNYLTIYHGLYPVNAASSYLLQDRILANYLQSVPKDQTAYIIGQEPRGYMLRYAFYSRTNPAIIQDQWFQNEYKIDNVIFTSECKNASRGITIVHKDKPDCIKEKLIERQKLSDNNQIWIWQGDQECLQYASDHTKFIYPKDKKSWQDIGKFTKVDLCKNWIIKREI